MEILPSSLFVAPQRDPAVEELAERLAGGQWPVTVLDESGPASARIAADHGQGILVVPLAGWTIMAATYWENRPEATLIVCGTPEVHDWRQARLLGGEAMRIAFLRPPFHPQEAIALINAVAGTEALPASAAKEAISWTTQFTNSFLHSAAPFALIQLPAAIILESNTAFREFTGMPAETHQARLHKLPCWAQSGTMRELVVNLREGSMPTPSDIAVQLPNHTERILRLTATPLKQQGVNLALISLQDLTRQHELEAELRKAQRMEAIGQLAAGLAHDFNNLLTIVLGYSGVAAASPDLPVQLQHDIKMVKDAATRAAALTRQLLVFSRRQPTQRTSVDPARIIAGLQKMLQRIVPANITVQWVCPAEAPCILADPSNIEQVLVNLVVNARDSMPEGGNIFVRLEAVEVLPEDTDGHPERKPGPYVRIEVEDTGCGMTPDVLDHIFEPFFSTKVAQGGTGLGLSTAYGIVRQHEGWIEVASQSGVGTKFALYFGLADEAPAESLTVSPFPGHDPVRTRRILLAEDDQQVRQIMAFTLTASGHHVVEAGTGDEAWLIWQNTDPRFDLVISDMIMPGRLSGRDLLAKIRQDSDDVSVILCTGYAADWNDFPADQVPPTILRKPFELAQLHRLVSETRPS